MSSQEVLTLVVASVFLIAFFVLAIMKKRGS